MIVLHCEVAAQDDDAQALDIQSKISWCRHMPIWKSYNLSIISSLPKKKIAQEGNLSYKYRLI